MVLFTAALYGAPDLFIYYLFIYYLFIYYLFIHYLFIYYLFIYYLFIYYLFICYLFIYYLFIYYLFIYGPTDRARRLPSFDWLSRVVYTASPRLIGSRVRQLGLSEPRGDDRVHAEGRLRAHVRHLQARHGADEPDAAALRVQRTLRPHRAAARRYASAL